MKYQEMYLCGVCFKRLSRHIGTIRQHIALAHPCYRPADGYICLVHIDLERFANPDRNDWLRRPKNQPSKYLRGGG